ncbi:MAG: hypothetical protein H0W68_12050 [Gemmatimonadaceae bacterium]|nr:hypothetical protein [Gemmatimonadaceae bacterium]
MIDVALWCALGAATSVPCGALAQTVANEQVVIATRQRDAGDLLGASNTLERHLAHQPEDLTATRLYAQTLYWLKDVPHARESYERALARWPSDVTLRLDYGRLLVDTGDRTRAIDVLTPLLTVAGARARAEALLGSAAYWSGDLDTAERLLGDAILLQPDLGDARRQLAEIRAIGAPSLRFDANAEHDDQPLDHVVLGAAFGWHPTPSSAMGVQGGYSSYRSADSLSTSLRTASVSGSRYLPDSHMELEGMLGVANRAGATDAIGRAAAGIRLPGHVALRVRGERDVYLYTLASLRVPVTTTTATVLLALDHPRGWLGEVAAQAQRYHDANVVRTGYAWLLAPVARGGAGVLQLGYGVSAQTADSSRYVFVPAANRSVYSPYYTPKDVVVQSVLAAARLAVGPGATLRVNGSYGLHATQELPTITRFGANAAGVGGVLVRGSYHNSFSPWTARAAFEVAPSSRLTLSVTAEGAHTAFYSRGAFGMRVERRLSR